MCLKEDITHMHGFPRRHLPIVWFLLCGIVTVTILGLFLAHFATRATGPTVQVWLTTSDGSNELTSQPSLTFGSNSGDSSTINVNEYQEYQQMDGFGAAVTDSSAWLIYTQLSHRPRDTLMQHRFSPRLALRLRLARLPTLAAHF